MPGIWLKMAASWLCNLCDTIFTIVTKCLGHHNYLLMPHSQRALIQCHPTSNCYNCSPTCKDCQCLVSFWKQVWSNLQICEVARNYQKYLVLLVLISFLNFLAGKRQMFKWDNKERKINWLFAEKYSQN